MKKIALLLVIAMLCISILNSCSKGETKVSSSVSSQKTSSVTSESSSGTSSNSASGSSNISSSSSTQSISIKVDNTDWSSKNFAFKDLGKMQLTSYPVDTVYDWSQSVMKMGNVYKMWWVRQSPHDTIWYAESTDLKNWTKERLIMKVKDTEWVKMHYGNPDVIYINNKYYMYYEAPATVDSKTGAECDNNVFLATSTDGMNFTLYPNNQNPQPIVRQPANTMRQGKYGVGQPSITYKDGEFVLYYVDGASGADCMRVARSKDGINFGSYENHTKVFGRAACGIKYNTLTKKFMLAYTLQPNVFDKSIKRTENVYLMESTDGIKWPYYEPKDAYKNPFLITDPNNAKIRGYADFVISPQGTIDTPTMYVTFMEGTLAGAGEEWKTTAGTWDGHIVAVNPKQYGKRTIDLPNGKPMNVSSIKAYADNNVVWKKQFATSKYGKPVIDGVMDAIWNNTQELSVNRQVANWASKPVTTRAKVRTMWDENNLYLYAYVKDSKVSYSYNIAFPEEMWHRDSIDFFIDAVNNDTQKETLLTPKQYLLSVCANGDFVVKDNRENDFKDDFTVKNVKVKIVSDGYIVEAALSWYDLVKSEIGKNEIIGFDVNINDDNGIGDRVGMVAWNDYTGNAFRWRDTWGDLKLVK